MSDKSPGENAGKEQLLSARKSGLSTKNTGSDGQSGDRKSSHARAGIKCRDGANIPLTKAFNPQKNIQKNIRSVKEIKQSLLRKAIAQDRGPEMIQLILWRLAEIKHHAAKDAQALEEARFASGQPQSVRALNTLAYYCDEDVRFSMSDQESAAGRYIHPTPEIVN